MKTTLKVYAGVALAVTCFFAGAYCQGQSDKETFQKFKDLLYQARAKGCLEQVVDYLKEHGP